MAQKQTSYSRPRGYTSQWKYIDRHCESIFHKKQIQLRQQEVPYEPKDTEDVFQQMEGSQESDLNVINDYEQNPDTTALPTLEQLSAMGFHPDSRTPRFLYHEFQQKGSGVRYLTGQAFSVDPNKVSPEEAQFCLQLSSLLVQLTERQREMLSEVLMTAGNNGNPALSIFQTIRLPTTTDDFDAFFLSGRKAIIPNLPHPIPNVVDNGSHSYVGLVDL